MTRLAARALDALRPLGTAERAAHEKRYLRSELSFLGVRVPEIRRVTRGLAREHPALDHAGLIDTVNALWAAGVHEARMVAVELLRLRLDLLGPADLPLVESLIRTSGTWAYVDNLASRVAGELANRHPELTATLDRWIFDTDFWVRRSALLALLPGIRNGAPDLERIDGYGDAVLGEREFFIRKALGWTLRELARSGPAGAVWVTDWLRPRIDAISGVTLREAVRPLPDGTRDELMAAYRARAA